jgi:FkbM family methyltransferase
MTFCESLFYWLHFGPFKRGFRFLARRCLAGCNRILLGPARGCAFAGADLPYRLGIYEIHVQRALARILKCGSVFYDVGANVGFFSLLGAKLVGDGGVVIAFEPSGDNGLALRSLCEANGVRNVQLISEAVSAVDGEAYFAQGTSHAQHHIADDQGAGGLKVRTVSLDSFTKTHSVPQVVLMDIEGAEFDALRGACNLLSLGNAPTWIIELHNADTDKLVTGILTKSGYVLTPLLPPVPRAGRYPIHLLAEKSQARVENQTNE